MDISAELKAQTSLIHQEFEQISLLNRIVTAEMTLQEYQKLLGIFYGFINPNENKIKLSHPNLLTNREKSHLLRADLAILEQLNLQELPFYEAPCSLATEAEIYGYLYVIEGATLGGQFITKALKANHHLSPQITTHYFNAYGKETRRMWSTFSLDLHKKFVTIEQKNEVINSAREVFTALLNWVRRNIQHDL